MQSQKRFAKGTPTIIIELYERNDVTHYTYNNINTDIRSSIQLASIFPYFLMFFRKKFLTMPPLFNVNSISCIPRASIVRMFQLLICNKLQYAEKYGRISIGWRLCIIETSNKTCSYILYLLMIRGVHIPRFP